MVEGDATDEQAEAEAAVVEAALLFSNDNENENEKEEEEEEGDEAKPKSVVAKEDTTAARAVAVERAVAAAVADGAEDEQKEEEQAHAQEDEQKADNNKKEEKKKANDNAADIADDSDDTAVIPVEVVEDFNKVVDAVATATVATKTTIVATTTPTTTPTKPKITLEQQFALTAKSAAKDAVGSPDASLRNLRRDRKSTDSFNPTEIYKSPKKRKEFSIPAGKGTALANMRTVVHNFDNIPSSGDDLKVLYGIVFGGVQGKKKDYKKHLLQFNGLVYTGGIGEKDAEMIRNKKKDKMHKLKMDELKAVMDLCDIDRAPDSFSSIKMKKTKKKSPDKEMLSERFLEWLEHPTVNANTDTKLSKVGSGSGSDSSKKKKKQQRRSTSKTPPAKKKSTTKVTSKTPPAKKKSTTKVTATYTAPTKKRKSTTTAAAAAVAGSGKKAKKNKKGNNNKKNNNGDDTKNNNEEEKESHDDDASVAIATAVADGDFDIPGVPYDKLKTKIQKIVDAADRETLTVKDVRTILEEWLDIDLTPYKESIRAVTLEIL